MAQPKLEDLVELAKAAQAWLKRAALASADAVKKWSQQVPDWETAQRSMRGAGTAIAQRLQSVHLEVFDLQDPQQVSSAEEFFYACKSLGLHSARELSKLPSTSAVVLFLLFLRGALALKRLSTPLLTEVLDRQLFQNRVTKLLVALPSLWILRTHHRHLLQDVLPFQRGHLSEAFFQLLRNTKPLPPLFWVSFAFAGLQALQVTELLALSALHVALRFKKTVLLSAMLLVTSNRLEASIQQLKDSVSPERREAVVAVGRQTWKILQDLASAAKAAALHSAGGAPAPRRIPPGSGVASPVASEERDVVAEIQQPPVFVGASK